MGWGQAHGVFSEMQMPNQNAKFVSAVFAGVLAGANFTPALNNSAHAEDNCLATPNTQTPHGSHWYYRLEHGTKRHCWYLREGSDTHAQSAAATSSPPPAAAKPAPGKPAPAKAAETPVQGSVANARAELPWPQPRTAPDASAPAALASAAPAADMPSSDGSQPDTSTMPTAAAGDTDMSQATIASRWPGQLNADASDDSAATADNSDAGAQPDTAAVIPPPPAATVPLATADASASSSNKQPGSMSMLLTIMIATLVLAGLVGGAILKFGGRKRGEEEEIDIDRRPVWDVDHTEHPLPYPAARLPAAVHRPNMQRPNTQRPNIGRPRELRTVEPDDAIKEMLARLARSAQT
jgi:hypothetical protein